MVNMGTSHGGCVLGECSKIGRADQRSFKEALIQTGNVIYEDGAPNDFPLENGDKETISKKGREVDKIGDDELRSNQVKNSSRYRDGCCGSRFGVLNSGFLSDGPLIKKGLVG